MTADDLASGAIGQHLVESTQSESQSLQEQYTENPVVYSHPYAVKLLPADVPMRREDYNRLRSNIEKYFRGFARYFGAGVGEKVKAPGWVLVVAPLGPEHAEQFAEKMEMMGAAAEGFSRAHIRAKKKTDEEVAANSENSSEAGVQHLHDEQHIWYLRKLLRCLRNHVPGADFVIHCGSKQWSIPIPSVEQLRVPKPEQTMNIRSFVVWNDLKRNDVHFASGDIVRVKNLAKREHEFSPGVEKQVVVRVKKVPLEKRNVYVLAEDGL